MKRNKHSLSHYKLLSMPLGSLIPIGCFEVLPGDTIQQQTSCLIRVAPLLAPIMHPVWVRLHHWFVPYRLVWEDWETFITGGPDGNDDSVFPTFSDESISAKSLADYLGVPPGSYTGDALEYSALPFRAYNMIYNEFYRDEDLCDEVDISVESGADTTTSKAVLRAAWQKDYFTSARPWEQKGDTVYLELGTSAPVVSDGTKLRFAETDGTQIPLDWKADGGDYFPGSTTAASGDVRWHSGAIADLSAVSGIAINDLRLGLSIQRYKEARARYGSRYVEYLRYLGVRPSDARLQRPEYLGGGRQTIQFSEVLQTAPDSTSSYVGDMKGHGIAAMRSNRYRRFFEEHGVVITIASVLPKAIYMDSLNKMYLRRTKEDFWQKELEHIGQQPIQNAEIQASHSNRTGTFGYQDRYDEYRRCPSSVSGEFRDVLDYWHYARSFSGDVALNSTFINANPTNRVYASTDTDPLYVMANHSIQARRMVCRQGTSFTF